MHPKTLLARHVEEYLTDLPITSWLLWLMKLCVFLDHPVLNNTNGKSLYVFLAVFLAYVRCQ